MSNKVKVVTVTDASKNQVGDNQSALKGPRVKITRIGDELKQLKEEGSERPYVCWG